MSELTFTERQADKNAHDSRIEMLKKVNRLKIQRLVRGLQMAGQLPKT
jgi:hypothetical protein